MKTFLACCLVGLTVLSASMVFAAEPADRLLGQYYVIQKNLSLDSTNGVSAAAGEIAKISRRSAASATKGKAQLTALAEAAAKLQTGNLKAARDEFGGLSDKLIAYLQAVQARTNPPYEYYCPMAKKNWLQPDKGARNPYYGSSMLTCGELVQAGQPAHSPAGPSHH